MIIFSNFTKSSKLRRVPISIRIESLIIDRLKEEKKDQVSDYLRQLIYDDLEVKFEKK
ncbi:hypothetical protein JW930_00230 [Candidatus Woesearchaeota archaeon]|nr:hypothetical protein [Candidatus Woesearchaeota archaeon]